VERIGGGGRAEERMGAGFYYLVHRKVRKDREGFYCYGFASLAFFVVKYLIHNIF